MPVRGEIPAEKTAFFSFFARRCSLLGQLLNIVFLWTFYFLQQHTLSKVQADSCAGSAQRSAKLTEGPSSVSAYHESLMRKIFVAQYAASFERTYTIWPLPFVISRSEKKSRPRLSYKDSSLGVIHDRNKSDVCNADRLHIFTHR